MNAPPTAAALEAAWKATRGGRRGDPAVLAARLRLGAMLSDLEPVVDQSYIRDGTGAIVGRQPGLRGWIGFYTPALQPHYKSLMAYKALADKLRLALHIDEPDTLDNVLELGQKQEAERSKNSKKSSAFAADMGDGKASEKTQSAAVDAQVDARDAQEVANAQVDARGAQEVANAQVDARDTKGVARDAHGTAKTTQWVEMMVQGVAKNAGKTPTDRVRTEGVSSNSMQLKSAIYVVKSNVQAILNAYHELFGPGLPGTMAALEAAVRERLGLAWMRRVQRKPMQIA